MNEIFADSNKSSQIMISRNSFEAGMEQVALVEEEIQSLDKKIREALSSLDKNHGSSAKADEPNLTDGNGARSLHLDELVKKSTHIPLRRSISNRGTILIRVRRNVIY